MALLTTTNLIKDYPTPSGDIRALNNLSIEIPEGATALLGPNGSGKSTLIRIILGLINATNGSFRLFGKGGADVELARNRIGYMPETPSIISKVNAVKFVRHFGILSGLSFTRAMQRAHEVLDYVGLNESRYREIEKYSTGMKQRLLFAQALVHDPDMVILDEPTSGLSPEGRTEMLDLIKEINQVYGKSIIFSTHILPDVENICNYTVLLNKGQAVFQGSMDDINSMYQDTVIIETTDRDRGLKLLKEHGYVSQIQGKSIVIEGDKLPTLQQVHQILAPAGLSIQAISQRRPNLEDLFLKTIQKDINQ